jgi:predicted nucleic acid-binding protein
MGTVLDTTVFVEFERATRTLAADRAMQTVGERLEDRLGADDQVAIAAITASELLHGVHRAAEEHRARREAFVEAVLNACLSHGSTQGSGRASPHLAPMSGRTTASLPPPRCRQVGGSALPTCATLVVSLDSTPR